MSCTKYKDRLIEAALGAPAPENVLAHVRECPACAAELERQRQLVAAMDRGIEQSVAADPSPEFLARVRTRLAEEPAPSRGWFSGWLPVTAGAVAVAALLVFWLKPSDTGGPSTAPPAAERADARPAVSLPVEPLPVETPATPAKRLEEVRAARKPVPPAVPEVLIPSDQQMGVAWLYRALQQRPEQVSAVLAEQVTYRSESARPIQVVELRMEPLDLPPLGPSRPTSF